MRNQQTERGRSLIGRAGVVAFATAALGGLGLLFREAGGPRPEPEPPESREASLLSLEVALAAWRAAPAGPPDRALARLQRPGGHPDLSLEELARLAAVARGLGRPDLAAQAGERAAALDPRGCAPWRSEAARDFLAAGDPGSAASSYARASACSADPGAGRALGLAALKAHLAAEQGPQALALADALLRRFPVDREVLEAAEQIALQQSDSARSLRFGTRLCDLGAIHPDRLRRLLDLHLAAGDLDGASRVAGRMVDRAPADPRARRTAADVAEWAGQHAVALGHRVWLARRPGATGEAVEGALRLARALPDHAVVAELLIRQSTERPLPPAALRELAEALERVRPSGSAADAADAADALEAHAARHLGSWTAWDELAAFRERRGELAAALAARQEMARRFGPSRDLSLQVARLQWALGRASGALAELARWSDSADPAAAGYWELLAELAWNQEADGLAARAYRALWDGERIGVAGVERLLLLLREARRPEEVIRLGREGWARLGEARLLLLAMDEAVRERRWDDLARLDRATAGAEGVFSGVPAYWMLRARLDEERGRTAEAVEDYRRALQADPASTAVRAGLIWLLVSAGDREGLSRWLPAWEGDAREEPGLWRPYAAGLELLGRHEEALAFHAREVEADPEDAEARARFLAAQGRMPRPPRPGVSIHAGLGLQSFGTVLVRRAEAGASTRREGAQIEVRAAVTDADGQPEIEIRADGAGEGLGGRTQISGGVRVRRGRFAVQGAAAHTRWLAPAAELRVEAAASERATESPALLLGGARSRAGGALTFIMGGGVYGRGGVEWRTWSWEEGSVLGSAGVGTLELGWRAPLEGPEITLRVQGDYQRSWPAGFSPPVAAAIPPGEIAAVGLGASAARWRAGPALVLADAWLGWVSHPGRLAYRLQAGLSTVPFDSAQLALTVHAASGQWDAGPGEVGLSASIAYQLPP